MMVGVYVDEKSSTSTKGPPQLSVFLAANVDERFTPGSTFRALCEFFSVVFIKTP